MSDAALSDEALMARYARGDGGAFQALFGRYDARAYRFFLSRTRSEPLAADLYQELFLRIHRARESYDASRPFAPWFFQIARHLVIDQGRRSTLRGCEVPLMEEVLPANAAGGGAEQRLEAEQSARRVLSLLSAVESHVLIAAKVDGRGYAEIGRELGKSAVAIKKLASRAMQRLRAAESAPIPALT